MRKSVVAVAAEARQKNRYSDYGSQRSKMRWWANSTSHHFVAKAGGIHERPRRF
jgi:hypothetical protein